MQILNESTLSKFFKDQSERSFGIITAFRGEYTYDVNKQLNRELKNDLRSRGLVADITMRGIYKEHFRTPEEREVKEESYLVFPKIGREGELTGLKKILMKLGEKYDQDSILYKSVYESDAYLIGTSKRENAYPSYHEEESLGEFRPKLIGEFYSRMRGIPFAFTNMNATQNDYKEVDRETRKQKRRDELIPKSKRNTDMVIESLELVCTKSIDRQKEVYLATFKSETSLYESIFNILKG